ncbi:MAG: hypothetical protein K6G19_06060 [Lachnospiraceae bacterium]|nr:hypothetical protein [Lachnospiraceae bacterium]
MEKTLTARDKKLLYMLGFIVIIFIFGWIIMRPMIVSINKTEEKIAEQKNERQQNEAKVMGVDTAGTLMEKFENDLSASVQNYYAPMDSSEIDKMMTSYVLGFGLYAKDLSITMPYETVSESPYIWSKAAAEAARFENIASYADSSSSELSEESVDGDAESGLSILNYTQTPLEAYTRARDNITDTFSSGVSCVEITMVMTGDEKLEQKLLDDIMKKPSIRLTYFAWDDLAPVAQTLEDGTVEVVESSDRQLTVGIKLYMYSRSDAGRIRVEETE